MQPVRDARAVLAGGEDHQEAPGRQGDVREGPWPGIGRVVGEVPACQRDVLVRHVLELDPVLVVALLVAEDLLVVGHHLRQDHTPGPGRRQEFIVDARGGVERVGRVGEIPDAGVGSPADRRGPHGQVRQREHIHVAAQLADRGGRQSVHPQIGGIDSLDRFAEVHLELGEAEDEPRFREECLDHGRHGFHVGPSSPRREAVQAEGQQDQQAADGSHRG